MIEAEIKQEIKNLIEQETNLELLEMIKAMFTHDRYDTVTEKEMISRALASENDIKDCRTMTIDEAEARINKHLGL